MLRLMPIRRGFTMVELMVTLAVLGILILIGLPNLSEWLQNTQIRTAAESIQNGAQLARTEAVRRNTQIEFALIAGDPNSGNANAAPNAAGPNWMVRNFQSSGTYTSTDFVQGGGTYSSPNVVIAATDPTAVFNGLGQTNLAAIDTIQITNPNGGNCVAAGGGMRCLNVVIQIGGQIRMCDPAVTTAGDTRAC
ncbi:MAG: GspH/FimT family pseudopilin [Burkholderiales bacterium]